ncbi:MAG: pentapeptide repeat-containing protein [Flavobacteriaceae bacterium]|nr:pentapeptide repeat-containing protein [Flavobacteriaceae bacterium]
MKKYLPLIFILFLSLTISAQRTVSAADILDDIKSGKAISYKNVTITGALDMTFMDEKLPDLPKKYKWYKTGGSNAIKESIEGKISFVNCVFEDDVLAYFHDEDSKYTFTASFENDVSFKNCEFKRNAMFKYSSFEGNADFSGSKFQKESTFKYAKFDSFVSFSNTLFEEYATFKYTKFKDGVSFNNAQFEDALNLKYTKVRGDFNVSGLQVAHEINSKYTDINGDGFSKYLLKNN